MKTWIRQFGIWSPWFANPEEFATLLNSTTAAPEANLASLGEPSAPPPKPELIPRNERRRAPLSVRLAVEVASQAMAATNLDSAQVASVFAFGQGDTDITDYMCRVLASDEKMLSPTKFHNSVHNAASGYWTISSECQQASNSICAFEQSVPLGLLEASCQVNFEDRPVLLVFYDIAPQPILQFPLNTQHSFAAALLMVPESMQSKGDVELDINPSAGEHVWNECSLPAFNEVYETNPAARCLPILQALAMRTQSVEGKMPTGANSGISYQLRRDA